MASFATSYIPTGASQATRAADVATIQGSNFYSWYNQNEGSIVSNNTKVSATSQDMYLISDGTLSNSLAIYADASNGTVAWNRTNGTNQVVSSLGEGITNSKTAYAYKIDNSAASVNGLNVVTDTVCLTPIVNQLSIGSQSPNVGGLTKQKWIKQISYYPQRLSNDVLKGLTA